MATMKLLHSLEMPKMLVSNILCESLSLREGTIPTEHVGEVSENVWG
jgi:hypothetical protein